MSSGDDYPVYIPEPEPTDEQIERLTNPNWEVDQHQARIAAARQKALNAGRTFGIRDYYDPRFDGPW